MSEPNLDIDNLAEAFGTTLAGPCRFFRGPRLLAAGAAGHLTRIFHQRDRVRLSSSSLRGKRLGFTPTRSRSSDQHVRRNCRRAGQLRFSLSPIFGQAIREHSMRERRDSG
jgi:hypothetical protein